MMPAMMSTDLPAATLATLAPAGAAAPVTGPLTWMPTGLAAFDGVFGFQVVAALLFVIGLVGFLTRRNLLIILLCGELMLQGVLLNLVAFDHRNTFAQPLKGGVFWDGQIFGLFILVVAAAEAGLGLAVVVMMFRRKHTLDASVWRMLWG